MNKVNRNAIKQLIESEDSRAISIYLPSHRFPTSEHITEDKIRFKNLVRIAKDALTARGVDDGEARQMTDELERGIYDNMDFWQHTTEGMAIFSAPAGVHYFHLPIECEERVSVNDQYDITPLLAFASYDKPYYLLALAVHQPVLYRGDMYGIEKVDVQLPESPEEALNIDETHANSKTDRAGGYPGTKAHGQGDSSQAGQEERLKFFRIIDDKILSSDAVDKSLPLLLAGGDDEVSGYREVSRARSLLEASLSGNHTEAAPHDIHELSWPLVTEELHQKEQKKELDRLGDLLGTGRASTEIGEIAAAANEGRVDTLLVGMLTKTRDTVKDSSELVEKLVFSENYEKNEVAACGRSVFDQGGKVMALFKDVMPNGASEAAIYRY